MFRRWKAALGFTTREKSRLEFEPGDFDFVQKMPRLHPEIAAVLNPLW